MSRSRHPLMIFALAGACVLGAFRPAHALKGLNADGSLDKTVISKAYFEGEFWTVINALEAFRKSGVPATREDSVYAFKYLSVVYAADPETRKKAESYMYQLIKMMPTIDLLDLYISDNIESIFQKVKSDYERLAQMRRDTAPPARAAAPAPPAASPAKATPVVAANADASAAPAAPAQSKPAKPGTGMKPWVPIAIAGVGAVASAFLLVSLKSQSSGNGDDAPRPVRVTVLTPNQGSQ
jgi:hypothetical protein